MRSGERPFPRMRRVNAIVWEVLAAEVHGLSDPRLSGVTITGVDTSRDLRRAVVFFSAADMSRLEETGSGLTSAAGRLQALLASQVRLKYTPRLVFPTRPGSDRRVEDREPTPGCLTIGLARRRMSGPGETVRADPAGGRDNSRLQVTGRGLS